MFGPALSVSHRDVLWLCRAGSSSSRGSALALANTRVRISLHKEVYWGQNRRQGDTTITIVIDTGASISITEVKQDFLNEVTPSILTAKYKDSMIRSELRGLSWSTGKSATS
jgi:hypothetical protein